MFLKALPLKQIPNLFSISYSDDIQPINLSALTEWLKEIWARRR